MAEITAFEAKNRLGRLLDRVESGEEITITRHGEAVARLIPVARSADRLKEALEVFAEVRHSLAKSKIKVSRAEARRWIEQGRR
jgi:prevent-host-death family protein